MPNVEAIFIGGDMDGEVRRVNLKPTRYGLYSPAKTLLNDAYLFTGQFNSKQQAIYVDTLMTGRLAAYQESKFSTVINEWGATGDAEGPIW